MDGLKLSPPWVTYWHMVKILFERDSEVTVCDIEKAEKGYSFDVLVDNETKYEAIKQLLPYEKEYGNVTIYTVVKPSNGAKNDPASVYREAFAGNPILKDVVTAKDFAGTEHVFVRFQPEVLQFFNDNMFDWNGNWSGLAEDIANEVFAKQAEEGVHFCTASLAENEE